jgi:hypothetical protein
LPAPSRADSAWRHGAAPEVEKVEKDPQPARVERVIPRAGNLRIHPSSDPGSPIEVDWSPAASSTKREVLRPEGRTDEHRGMKAEARSPTTTV